MKVPINAVFAILHRRFLLENKATTNKKQLISSKMLVKNNIY